MRSYKTLIAALLLLLFVLYYKGCVGVNRHFYNAVPESAILLTDVCNAQEVYAKLSDTNYWLDYQNMEIVSKLTDGFAFLDTTFLRNSGGKKVRLLASLHLTKADDFDYLLITNRSVLGTSLERYVSKAKQANFKVEDRVFKGVSIYEFKIPNTGRTFTIANDGQLLFGSFSAVLVDEAIKQYNGWSGNGIQTVRGVSSSRYDATLYFNFKNFPYLSTVFLKNGTKNSVFDQLQEMVNYAKLGINFEPKTLHLEGQTAFNENNPVFHALLRQKSGTEAKMPAILPFNTAYLVHNRVASFKKFKWKAGSSLDKSFKSYCSNWVGSEWAYGFTEPVSDDFASSSFLVLEATDVGVAFQSLGKLKTGESAVQYGDYELHPTDGQLLFSSLFGERIGKNFKTAYYTAIENYVVVCNNSNQLKVMIENYKGGQLLTKEKGFQDFSTQLDKNSNVFMYVQPSRLRQLLKYNASPSFAEDIKTKFDYYQHITPVAFQMNGNPSATTTSGLIGYSKLENKRSTLMWNLQLDAAPAMPPQVVKNHETGEREVIVQDKDKKLYLISNKGEIVWKRQMEQFVLGNVHQMDFLKNGKLQYLFSTQTRIYLLNRQSEDVYNFPIRLSSAANKGLDLFDFGQQEYFFFVPCGIDALYGYEYSGKPLNGWSPHTGLGYVDFPLRYFRSSGQEFVVAANDVGEVFLMDRFGREKHKVELGSPLISAPQIDRREGDFKIMVSCRDSMTYTITKEGKFWGEPFMRLDSTCQFMTANVIGSAAEESIFLQDGKVHVYNYTEKMYDYTFPNGAVPTEIYIVRAVGDDVVKIGAFCAASQELYLLEKYGKFHADFPIKASTRFTIADLYDSGENILIAGGLDRNVFAYKVE